MFRQLKQELTPFLDEIFRFTTELNLDVSNLEIDHIALRYKNAADVDKLAGELKEQGDIISQAILKGRKIYIFKLHHPLKYQDRQIPCIELPYPATNHEYPHDGWEHVEFVLPTEDLTHFESVFRAKFPDLTGGMLQKYHYRLSLPQVDTEQLPNPIIVLKKYQGLAIKFHAHSIEEVVTS